LERWETSRSTEKFNFAKRIRRDRPAGVPRGDRLVLCRVLDTDPLMIYNDLSTSAEGRCPKAFREGTRGRWRVACRLWGFDGAAVAAWVMLAG
jgi:hypothetical protein